MTDSTSTASAPAKIQTNVEYLPGISIVDAEPALLEWSADDRIKLFKMDFDKNIATEVIFDAALSEVEGVSGSTVMLTFKIAGKTYNALFSGTAMGRMGIGGIAGIARSNQASEQSGIYLWVNSLKLGGVNLSGFKGFGWSMKVGLAIAAGTLVIAIIYVIVKL